MSVILTPDQTVIFKVTLFNETFNKIDVYLENSNWEDAQPGYYNVYLKNGEKIRPEGHVVVRVYEGGEEFQVFVLNDRNTDYDVIYKTDRITSNK